MKTQRGGFNPKIKCPSAWKDATCWTYLGRFNTIDGVFYYTRTQRVLLGMHMSHISPLCDSYDRLSPKCINQINFHTPPLRSTSMTLSLPYLIFTPTCYYPYFDITPTSVIIPTLVITTNHKHFTISNYQEYLKITYIRNNRTVPYDFCSRLVSAIAKITNVS